jgi:hypothetical protein
LACEAIHALVNPACRAITDARRHRQPNETTFALLKGVVVGIGASCIAFLAVAATPGNVCTVLSVCSFFSW